MAALARNLIGSDWSDKSDIVSKYRFKTIDSNRLKNRFQGKLTLTEMRATEIEPPKIVIDIEPIECDNFLEKLRGPFGGGLIFLFLPQK